MGRLLLCDTMPPHNSASSLRYLSSKVHAALAEVFETLTSSTNRSLLSIVERGLEVYNSPLTGLMVYTGKAMAPTLNPTVTSTDAGGAAEATSAEKLLVRWLRHPSPRNVFPNDVRLDAVGLAVVGQLCTSTPTNNNQSITGSCIPVTLANYRVGRAGRAQRAGAACGGRRAARNGVG